MAVVKATIQQAIVQLQQDMLNQTDQTAALNFFADGLSTIIANAVLSAQVVAGIPVTTAGSATAQQGATTGLGTLQ